MELKQAYLLGCYSGRTPYGPKILWMKVWLELYPKAANLPASHRPGSRRSNVMINKGYMHMFHHKDRILKGKAL